MRYLVVILIYLLSGCSIIKSSKEITPGDTQPTRKYERKTESSRVIKPDDSTQSEADKLEPSEDEDVLNAAFTDVWFATIEGIKWMKWAPIYVDEKQGDILLKEAYVYNKSGKIVRTFKWPDLDSRTTTSIDDYLQKISFYNPNDVVSKPIFSQESMTINIKRVRNTKTKVEIEYKITPYLESGEFAKDVKSNNYIESVLIKKIKENLSGSLIE